MKDKFIQNDNHEEVIDQALRALREEIDAPAVFKSELEQRLVNVHQTRSGSSVSFFKQALPVLGWAMGLAVLALFLNWVIRGIVSTPPIPAAVDTSTPFVDATPSPIPTGDISPQPDAAGYDWRNTKLYLAQSLPASPTEANILLLKESRTATVEISQALAQQFGIQGDVFETPGRSPNTTDYMVTDGKQRLLVQSNLLFDYYADYNHFANLSGGTDIALEQARVAIDEFLISHNLSLEYELERGPQTPGLFYAIPLAENGLPIRFDYNLPNRLEFTIGDDGQVVVMSSIRVEYDALGSYGILTAEEALQKILDNSDGGSAGVVESMRSGEMLVENYWQPSYPENETITIYGQPIFYPSFEEGRSGFFAIGQYTATGNTSGLENLDATMVVEATGRFFTENDVRRFDIESWSVSSAAETSFMGTLRRDGQSGILTIDTGEEYHLEKIPDEVPLEVQLIINGFLANGNFVWTSIQHFASDTNRGGGGGGGIGFYQLNLSGTPVPFPTSTPQAIINPGGFEYVIKEGDTIVAIAQAYGVAPDEIFQANAWLTEEQALLPGKTLIIPSAQSNPGSSEYIVQENDTLTAIALNHGITVDELMQANGITDPLIFVGQKLIIPGQGSNQDLIGQRIEGKRGTFTVSIYRQQDGSQHVEYALSSMPNDGPFSFAILEGANLQDLRTYHNIPIDIWGTINRIDQNGNVVLQVERYEFPFPDLHFQLLEGTQRTTEINGQSVVLFTSVDGMTYVQIMPNGEPDSSILGFEGDAVILESLAVPGETFGSYPTLRVFSGGVAVNPKNGQVSEMTITANQPYILDEFPPEENTTYPTFTIETVELVYYTSDPRYPQTNSEGQPSYIQPAWRFHGHNSSGDEFEFLVQALKPEYLLPEILPHTPPG